MQCHKGKNEAKNSAKSLNDHQRSKFFSVQEGEKIDLKLLGINAFKLRHLLIAKIEPSLKQSLIEGQKFSLLEVGHFSSHRIALRFQTLSDFFLSLQ